MNNTRNIVPAKIAVYMLPSASNCGVEHISQNSDKTDRIATQLLYSFFAP